MGEDPAWLSVWQSRGMVAGTEGDDAPRKLTQWPRPEIATVKAKRWTVTIKNWHPTFTNVLLASHWAKAGRLKKQDALHLAAELILAGVTRANGKRRVEVEIRRNRGRKPDSEAASKSLKDALVAGGFLVDDSTTWAEFPEPVISTGAKATILTIEELA